MKTLVILGLAAGMAVAGSAVALDRNALREAAGAAVQASFDEADGDGSGALDLDEFRLFHEIMRARMLGVRFERIDADDDGGVTLSELEDSARKRRHRRRRRF